MALVSRARAAALAAAIGIALAASQARAQAGPTEVQVKAVFLYNFTKYVDWPPQAFHAAGDPLAICLLDGDTFAPAVEQTIRGEVVKERSLVARVLSRPEDADDRSCSIVYVSSAVRDVRTLLKHLAGKPVLTVGETDDFALSGGMINLRKEQNRIHFEINQEAAERAGLRISSQLLKLGRIVVSRTD